MDYEKFRNILKGHKNTTIDIIAEKSSKGTSQVNLKIKGKYPIIADHLLFNMAYQFDNEILNRERMTLDDESIEISMRCLLFEFFGEYLIGENECTKEGRKRIIKIAVNNVSFEEIQKKPRRLEHKIGDYSIKTGELKVEVNGRVTYRVPEFFK